MEATFQIALLSADATLCNLYATEYSTKLKKLQEADPEAKVKTDAGCDVYCKEEVRVPAFGTACIRFGIACKNIYKEKQGYWLMPRSSFGKKTPLVMANSMGLIDHDYRGELMAYVRNVSAEPFVIEKYSSWFQLVLPEAMPSAYQLVESLDSTARQDRGFGTTYSSVAPQPTAFQKEMESVIESSCR